MINLRRDTSWDLRVHCRLPLTTLACAVLTVCRNGQGPHSPCPARYLAIQRAVQRSSNLGGSGDHLRAPPSAIWSAVRPSPDGRAPSRAAQEAIHRGDEAGRQQRRLGARATCAAGERRPNAPRVGLPLPRSTPLLPIQCAPDPHRSMIPSVRRSTVGRDGAAWRWSTRPRAEATHISR